MRYQTMTLTRYTYSKNQQTLSPWKSGQFILAFADEQHITVIELETGEVSPCT
jgi:hypothetical protein